jgi:hypothetical protein
MRFIIAIALGMVMLVSGGVFTATGDDPPFTLLPPDQRLAYSELVCSATIVDNQLTGRTMNFGSLTTAENMARADVDSVFKGSLTGSTVTLRWYSWPVGAARTEIVPQAA